MYQNLIKRRLLSSPDFSQNPLSEIQEERPDDESPALVPKAMLCVVERERALKVRIRRVANETACCMGVERQQEEKGKVVGIPEGFKRLLANLGGGR